MDIVDNSMEARAGEKLRDKASVEPAISSKDRGTYSSCEPCLYYIVSTLPSGNVGVTKDGPVSEWDVPLELETTLSWLHQIEFKDLV